MDTNWDAKFTDFLRRDNRYAKAPGVLLTSTSDDERERGSIDASMRNFYSANLDFKNKSTVAYDPVNHDLSGVKLVNLEAEVQPNGVLVVGTHGNIHWLFGNLPGQEKKAAEKFVGKLHALEAHHGIKLTTIVLDSCWSAAELKTPTGGVPNVSPARALSAVLGPKYIVLGFNGKSAERHVSYVGHSTEAKFKNAIIFCNGEPISGSQHDSPGDGLQQSGGTLVVDKTRPHYNKLFEGQKPAVYRTNSFSNLKEFKK